MGFNSGFKGLNQLVMFLNAPLMYFVHLVGFGLVMIRLVLSVNKTDLDLLLLFVVFIIFVIFLTFNPLNAELNPICHLLALLGAHHIHHVGRIRVKNRAFYILDGRTATLQMLHFIYFFQQIEGKVA